MPAPRADYDRLVDAGVFGPSDRVELLEGEIIETCPVSDTSLEYDRTRKARVYAKAAIAEYWIVNVVEGVLEVHRDPGPAGYRLVSRLTGGEAVSPLAADAVSVPVSDLLP
jgi:hypothetical protein